MAKGQGRDWDKGWHVLEWRSTEAAPVVVFLAVVVEFAPLGFGGRGRAREVRIPEGGGAGGLFSEAEKGVVGCGLEGW